MSTVRQTRASGDSGDAAAERTRLAPAGWYRHPADVARLIVALAVTAFIALVVAIYPNGVRRASTDLVRLVSNLPGWLTSFVVGFLQLAAVLTPIVLLGVLVLRRKWAILGLLALAAALAAALVFLGRVFVEDTAPAAVEANEKLDSWFTDRSFPSGIYLAMAAAVATAAGPFLRRSWRRTAWVAVGAAAVLRLLTAAEVPVNLATGLAIGCLAGSLALVLLGAPPQRIDTDLVRSVLERCGLDARSITSLSQNRGSPTVLAELDDGGAYVRVLGREERDTDLLLRMWRALRVKGLGDHRPTGTARRVAENAALAESLAATAGACVPTVLGVATTDVEGAVLLIDEYVDGVPLSAMTGEEIGDDLLADVWHQVDALRRRRIAHRWLDAKHVRVRDGAAVIVDFRSAVTAAREDLLAADVVELLASTSALVGVARAVATARDVLGPAALADALPLLQPVVLRPRTREQMKPKARIEELRAAVQQAAGVDTIELAQIQRITVKGVVSLVGSAVLAYYVISLLADWQDIWDTMKSADWSSLPLMLALMVGSYVGGAISLMGAVNTDLAFGRTVEVMFGQSFLNRFTPANAGGMALRARYLQLAGTDLTVAAAAVGLTSAASGVVQGVLLVVFAFWGGATGAFENISLPQASTILLVLIAIAAVVGLIVLSGWGRRTVIPWTRRTWDKAFGSFRELAKRPAKMVELFGGALFAKMSTVIAFYVSVHAFGVDMSFARAGALYMVANTIGSAVPTPGGVGGIEAALTAALIAAGVDDATAASIVLFFRLWTFWFPTLPGWFYLQRIQREGIV
jgi:undecaprenyl-diphosphatase